MRNIKKQLAILMVVAFILTNIFAPFSTVAAKQNTSEVPKEKVEILIKYKDESKAENIKSKVKSKLKIGKLDSKKKNKKLKIELLEINQNDNLDNVIKELKSDPNVLFAQPNYKLNIKAADNSSVPSPSDDRFKEQWGLDNAGQTIEYANGTEGQDISALAAWNITKGSPSVLIGVLDTGIDINHQDLKNNIFINSNEIPNNGADDDGNGLIDDINGWDFANEDNTVYDDADNELHGTHVAGVIAAEENGIGIVGTAPKTKILPLKFITGGTGYTSDAIEAIEYASRMGVKILNCSFAGSDNNPALKEAMAASNILFVCAAGNDGKDISKSPVYPASFELSNVITVAASNNNGQIAALSNYGIAVDVTAPGINILSTEPENSYAYKNGTSFSAPYVAGIAALLQSVMSDMTAAQLATRIKSTAVKSDETTDKVAYGMANADAALTNKQTSSGNVVEKPSTSDTSLPDNKSVVSVMAATVAPELLEQIHYGEAGVNVATGNYSKTDTDMSVLSPGFTVNMSRTYNSKDERATSTMGRGWTFGFEGSLKKDPGYSTNSVLIAKLPNGSAQVFIDNKNGTYTANDSRSTLVKNTDGTSTLTTKDQYTYIFNTTKTVAEGYLTEMRDRNQNAVKISVDTTGKVNMVTDTVGRQFTITYDANSLISKISDVNGKRFIKYNYNTNKLLTTASAITSEGASAPTLYTYEYDTSKYLTKVTDGLGNVLEQITYDHATGTNQHKVTWNIDEYGNKYTYTYDATNRITTIKDSSTPAAITMTKKYDTAYFITESTDPEGKVTKVEYYLDSNNYNKYGEEKKITDRNGNVTEYSRDERGNITKIINPDKSVEENTFDSKNNTISEKDENGKLTYCIYDIDGIRLLKKVQPMNGTDAYDGNADQSKYSVTRYVYYTDEEARSLGYKANGLLKQQIDPTGGVTGYTYDADGNQITITDPEGNTTRNEYNAIGWLTKKVSASGFITTYSYDTVGRIVRTVLDNGETIRNTYDIMGRTTQEISPNQYDETKDSLNTATQTYSDKTVGTRYTYYPSGKVKTQTDVMNNITEYTYDIYGNTLSEKLTDNTGNEKYTKSYTYDVRNRLKTVSFKGKSDPAPSTLESYTYSILADGKTKKIYTQYLNTSAAAITGNSTSEAAITEYTYDYAQRQVEQKNPDGGKLTTVNNPNGTIASTTDAMGNTTYFKYDGLNNLSEKWIPIDDGLYSYQKLTYDKSNRKTSEKTGKDKVELFSVPSPDRLMTKTYTYYLDGKLQIEEDSCGKKIVYQYDTEGHVRKQDVFTSKDSFNTTEYVYNHLGKVASVTTYMDKADLYGNNELDTGKEGLTTNYSYDKNGNTISVKTPDGLTTTYRYDELNRQTNTEKQQIDENGLPVVAKTHTSYDYQGNVLSTTDALGNTTLNTYNERGLLTKSKKTVTVNGNATDYITAYFYDLAGRKIAEVTPENYNASVPYTDLSYKEMNRTEYVYDRMGRIIAKIEVYKNKETDTSFKTLVSKAYKYDINGNVIKELDGEGYNYGVGTTLDSRIKSGYGIEKTYNAAGLLETETDAVSKDNGLLYSKKYTYDGALRKATETNTKGVITCYYYDDAGHLASTAIKKSSSDPELVVGTTKYDFVGNVIEKTDGNGNKTIYQYNSINKLKKTIYPSDASISEYTETCQYDVMGNLAEKQDSMGKQSLFTYDNEGRRLTQTKLNVNGKESITSTETYNLIGNKIYETDANGTVKENKYDEQNRLIESKVSSTDTNNKKTIHLTQYQYDKNGNQIKQINCLAPLTTEGSISFTTTGSIEMIYDPINRVIEKKDAHNTIQKLEYNASHLQTKSIDGNGNVTEYTYDRDNRLLATSDAENHVTKQTYDRVGNTATKVDGNGNVTTYTYDQFNRLIQVTNAKGEKTSYTYDVNGNMLTQTDGKGNVTTYEYNSANKQTRKIDHGGKTVSQGVITYNPDKTEIYTYYPNALMATQIDRNGKTTNYKYDIHGRLISKAIDNHEITYSYDANGNQLSMTDETGTTTRIYDELNRVIVKSVPNIGASTFQYDILLNSQTVPELSAAYTIPDGSTAEKSKDAKGNETVKVSDAAGRLIYVVADGEVTSYTYDANGNRASVVYPDGKTKEEYQYYKDNLLHQLSNTKTVMRNGGSSGFSSVVIDSYKYYYDSAHNLISKDEFFKGKTEYKYDSLNRLIEVLEPTKYTGSNPIGGFVTNSSGSSVTDGIMISKGRDTNYTYDAAGNRETEKVTTVTTTGSSIALTTYNYNEQNRLISTTEETGDGTKKTSTYSYDNNGNMTRKSFEQTRQIDPSNPPKAKFGMFIEGQKDGATKNAKPIIAGTASYEYDVWNQLIKATTGEGTSTYKYNAEGYRTEKTENGVTTRSLYEADKVVLETDSNGKETTRNIYGTNLISRKVTTTTNGTTQKEQYYYMYNGHGDVTALLGTDGTIKASYYYDAFGTTIEKNEPSELNNPYRYAGYVFDSSTNLYYLNARYYDSEIARFMSEDTYRGQANDPLSLNLYTYCRNEPVMYTDPTGHFYIIDQFRNAIDKVLKDKDKFKKAVGSVIDNSTKPSSVSITAGSAITLPSNILSTEKIENKIIKYLKGNDRKFVDTYSKAPYTDKDGEMYRYKMEAVPSWAKVTNLITGNPLQPVPFVNKIGKYMEESILNVVGGSSKSEDDALDYLTEFGVFAGGKIGGYTTSKVVKLLSGAVDKVDTLNTTMDLIKEMGDSQDDLMFELMEKGNISVFSNDKESLDDRAKYMKAFIIGNSDYLIDTVKVYNQVGIFTLPDGKLTKYELDKKLASMDSNDRKEYINLQVDTFRSDLITSDALDKYSKSGMDGFKIALDSFCNDYADYLNSYNQRLSDLKSSLNEAKDVMIKTGNISK